ncbi:MAG: MgtC/SapB family protein [Candidatus Hodarchaeota archaeon]
MQELLLSPDIVIRCLIGFAVGALIGLERQKREFQEATGGVRSFGLLSLFGTLAAYTYTVTGNPVIMIFAVAMATILIGVQMTYKMFRTMKKGMTTSIVLAIAFLLGLIVGLDEAPPSGQLVGPLQVLAMTVAFLVFLVLGFKEELSAAVAIITREEMISAVELAVLVFFLWPLIPPTVEFGNIVVPTFQIYLLVIILLSISFVNYILVKKFRSRGQYFFGFFGGFANSEATVTSLTEFHVKTDRAFPGRIALSTLFANIAMVLRNGVILILVDPSFLLAKYYLIPLAILILGGMIRMYIEAGRRKPAEEEQLEGALVSPFEIGPAIRFAVVFTGVSVLSLVLQDAFSDIGILLAAVLGGFASAGAIVATVGLGFAGGSITLATGVMAVILATTTSVLNKMIYVYVADRETNLLKKVAIDSFIMSVGVIVFLVLLISGIIPIV